MAEKKIPVLTEVYQPKESAEKAKRDAEAIEVTPALTAKVAEEIKQSVLVSLREEIKATIVSEHQAELDQAMQAQLLKLREDSEKTLVSNLATVLAEQQAKTVQLLDANVETYKESIKNTVEAHTQTLDSQLAVHKEHVKNTSEVYIQSFQEKVHSIQNDVQDVALVQINQNLTDAMSSVFEPMIDGIKARFNDEMSIQAQQIKGDFLTELNGELPQVQQILSENIEKILENTIPIVEETLRQKLTADIQDLLLKVKFVLP